MNYVHNVLHVFFGTVRRAGWTLGVLTVLYFMSRPQDLVAIVRGFFENVFAPVLREIVNSLANAVGPVMGNIVTLVIVFFAFRFLFRKASGGGQKKK